MIKQENLTNEFLQGICENNFDLTHYAIGLGKFYIKSGQEMSLSDILDEIKKHPSPEYLEELKELEMIEEPEEE